MKAWKHKIQAWKHQMQAWQLRSWHIFAFFLLEVASLYGFCVYLITSRSKMDHHSDSVAVSQAPLPILSKDVSVPPSFRIFTFKSGDDFPNIIEELAKVSEKFPSPQSQAQTLVELSAECEPELPVE